MASTPERIGPNIWRWGGRYGVAVFGVLQSSRVFSVQRALSLIGDVSLIWERVSNPRRLTRDVPEIREITTLLSMRGKVVIGLPPEETTPFIMAVFSVVRGQRAENALRDLAQTYGNAFPPDLAALFYAATLLPPGEASSMPDVILALNRSFPVMWTSEPLPRSEIRRLARKFVDHNVPSGRPDTRVDMPASPIERVQWLAEVSALLWRPKTIRQVARKPWLHSGMTFGYLISMFASIHLALAPEERVTVGQQTTVPLRGTEGFTRALAWPQIVEFERGGITPQVFNALTGNTLPSGDPTVNREFPPANAPGLDSHLQRATVQALLEEAEQGPFLPHGTFTLFLPGDFPLRSWGVSALRVVAVPNPPHLWVAALDQKGRPSVCFRWDPGQPLARWVVAEKAAPLLELTLAALWHDLRVAREQAFPERKREGKDPRKREDKTQKRAAHRSTLYLPRTVYRIRGKRNWGGEAEARAARRAHAVREHLRRLPEGWRASKTAEEAARTFGYVLPAGYTFVRPHVRGVGKEEEDAIAPRPKEQVVVARGLVTVMTVVRGATTHSA